MPKWPSNYAKSDHRYYFMIYYTNTTLILLDKIAGILPIQPQCSINNATPITTPFTTSSTTPSTISFTTPFTTPFTTLILRPFLYSWNCEEVKFIGVILYELYNLELNLWKKSSFLFYFFWWYRMMGEYLILLTWPSIKRNQIKTKLIVCPKLTTYHLFHMYHTSTTLVSGTRNHPG